MSAFTNLLTDSIHGDAEARDIGDVAPAIHVTTTFEYTNNPDELYPAGSGKEPILAYSREVHQNSLRVEAVLSKILNGYCVSYSSGLSAFHALLCLKAPKRLFIGAGYHGVHGVSEIFQRTTGMEIRGFEEIEEHAQPGDFVHVETPINPTGIAMDLAAMAERAHAKGAYITVDATFAPPPLMDPFKHGADYIMHSATKYLGGHSDLLAGVLVTKNKEDADALIADRGNLGTIIPSLEAWTLLRSLKTYPLRMKQQSENVNAIVKFLNDNFDKFPKLTKIYSANLQTEPFIKEQLPLGGSPTFAIEVVDEKTAKELPSKLKLFYHATSLGSVHSLVEWRSMSDATVSPKLLRFSIGIEQTEDLIEDIKQALQ